jgi:hypothetical protein
MHRFWSGTSRIQSPHDNCRMKILHSALPDAPGGGRLRPNALPDPTQSLPGLPVDLERELLRETSHSQGAISRIPVSPSLWVAGVPVPISTSVSRSLNPFSGLCPSSSR